METHDRAKLVRPNGSTRNWAMRLAAALAKCADDGDRVQRSALRAEYQSDRDHGPVRSNRIDDRKRRAAEAEDVPRSRRFGNRWQDQQAQSRGSRHKVAIKESKIGSSDGDSATRRLAKDLKDFEDAGIIVRDSEYVTVVDWVKVVDLLSHPPTDDD